MVKLRVGDYCSEQHQLILKQDAYLRDLVTAVMNNADPRYIAFLAATSQSALLDVVAYNKDYRAWLEDKRRK